jgi:hypothetical protein
LVDFTTTATCPDREDVVTHFKGFLVEFATGSGPFIAGQASIAGSSNDGVIKSTWDFRRP